MYIEYGVKPWIKGKFSVKGSVFIYKSNQEHQTHTTKRLDINNLNLQDLLDNK